MIRGFLLVTGLFLASDAVADLTKTGGNHPTVNIQIECVGYSESQAKQECFDSAIEQVVGQVIISDAEVTGDNLTKDFIGKYSAGYIDNYKILEKSQDHNNSWHIKMSVSVASSKIAQRMMSKGEHSEFIDGDRVQIQLSSQLEQRDQGDRLIGQVLSSYPENAYIINSGQTEFKINKLRQPYVDLPYSITMSRQWVEAFNEALELVAVNATKCNTLTMVVSDGVKQSRTGNRVKQLAGNICGTEPDIRVFYKSGFFPTANSYYFADSQTLYMINNELKTELGQQHIGLRVDLLDAGGNQIDSRCARINNELFVNYSKPRGTYNLNTLQQDSRPNIMGQNNVYGTLRVNINDIGQLQDLAKIKLNIQRTCA